MLQQKTKSILLLVLIAVFSSLCIGVPLKEALFGLKDRNDLPTPEETIELTAGERAIFRKEIPIPAKSFRYSIVDPTSLRAVSEVTSLFINLIKGDGVVEAKEFYSGNNKFLIQSGIPYLLFQNNKTRLSKKNTKNIFAIDSLGRVFTAKVTLSSSGTILKKLSIETSPVTQFKPENSFLDFNNFLSYLNIQAIEDLVIPVSVELVDASDKNQNSKVQIKLERGQKSIFPWSNNVLIVFGKRLTERNTKWRSAALVILQKEFSDPNLTPLPLTATPTSTPIASNNNSTPTIPKVPTPGPSSSAIPIAKPQIVNGEILDFCFNQVCVDQTGIQYDRESKLTLIPDKTHSKCLRGISTSCVDSNGVKFYLKAGCLFAGTFPYGWKVSCDEQESSALEVPKINQINFDELAALVYESYPNKWNDKIDSFDKIILGHNPKYGQYTKPNSNAPFVSAGNFKRVWKFHPSKLDFGENSDNKQIPSANLDAKDEIAPVTIPPMSPAEENLLKVVSLKNHLEKIANRGPLEKYVLRQEEKISSLAIEIRTQPLKGTNSVLIDNPLTRSQVEAVHEGISVPELLNNNATVPELFKDESSLFKYRNSAAKELNEEPKQADSNSSNVEVTEKIRPPESLPIHAGEEGDRGSLAEEQEPKSVPMMISIKNSSLDNLCLGYIRHPSSVKLKVNLPLEKVPLIINSNEELTIPFENITPIIQSSPEHAEQCAYNLSHFYASNLSDSGGIKAEEFAIVFGFVSCSDRNPLRTMTYRLKPKISVSEGISSEESCLIDSMPVLSGEGNYSCPEGLSPQWQDIPNPQNCSSPSTLPFDRVIASAKSLELPTIANGSSVRVLTCGCPSGQMLDSNSKCAPLSCSAGSVLSQDGTGCACDSAGGFVADPCTGACVPMDCGQAQVSNEPPPGSEQCPGVVALHCKCPGGLQFKDGHCQAPDCGPNSYYDPISQSCECNSGYVANSSETGGTVQPLCPSETQSSTPPPGCVPQPNEPLPDPAGKDCPDGTTATEKLCAEGEKTGGNFKKWTCSGTRCDKNGNSEQFEYETTSSSASCECPNGKYLDPALRVCLDITCPPGQVPESLTEAELNKCPAPNIPFKCITLCENQPNTHYEEQENGNYACVCNQGFYFNEAAQSCLIIEQCEAGQVFNFESGNCEDICPSGYDLVEFDADKKKASCACPSGKVSVNEQCVDPCPEDSCLVETPQGHSCVPRCQQGFYRNGDCITQEEISCSSRSSAQSESVSSLTSEQRSSLFRSNQSVSAFSAVSEQRSSIGSINSSADWQHGNSSSESSAGISKSLYSSENSLNSAAAAESGSSVSRSSTNSETKCTREISNPAPTCSSIGNQIEVGVETGSAGTPPLEQLPTLNLPPQSFVLEGGQSKNVTSFNIPYLGSIYFGSSQSITQNPASIILAGSSDHTADTADSNSASAADPKPSKEIEELVSRLDDGSTEIGEAANILDTILERIKELEVTDSEVARILKKLESTKNPSEWRDLLEQLSRKLYEPSEIIEGKKTYKDVREELNTKILELWNAAKAVVEATIPGYAGPGDIVVHLFDSTIGQIIQSAVPTIGSLLGGPKALTYKERLEVALKNYERVNKELNDWMKKTYPGLTQAAQSLFLSDLMDAQKHAYEMMKGANEAYQEGMTQAIGQLAAAKTPIDILAATLSVHYAMKFKNPEMIAIAMGAFTYAMEELRGLKDAAIASGMDFDEFLKQRGKMHDEISKKAEQSAIFAAVITEAFLRARWGTDKLLAGGGSAASRALIYERIIKGLEVAGISTAAISIYMQSILPAVDALVKGDYKTFASKAGDAGIDAAQLLNITSILKKFGIVEVPTKPTEKPGTNEPTNPTEGNPNNPVKPPSLEIIPSDFSVPSTTERKGFHFQSGPELDSAKGGMQIESLLKEAAEGNPSALEQLNKIIEVAPDMGSNNANGFVDKFLTDDGKVDASKLKEALKELDKDFGSPEVFKIFRSIWTSFKNKAYRSSDSEIKELYENFRKQSEGKGVASDSLYRDAENQIFNELRKLDEAGKLSESDRELVVFAKEHKIKTEINTNLSDNNTAAIDGIVLINPNQVRPFAEKRSLLEIWRHEMRHKMQNLNYSSKVMHALSEFDANLYGTGNMDYAKALQWTDQTYPGLIDAALSSISSTRENKSSKEIFDLLTSHIKAGGHSL